MNKEIFIHKFNECWALLEKGRPPEGKSAAYFRKVKHLDAHFVVRAFDYFNKCGDGFPTGPDLVAQIRYCESSAKSNVLLVVPPHVLEMTEEEIEADFQQLSSFYKAYPYPDTSPPYYLNELKRIDRNYHNLMRRFGIDPDEPMNPEVAKKLAAEGIDPFNGGLPEVPW